MAWAAFAQIGCDHGTEMIYPAPNGLVRDHNPTFRQQVFHVSKAKREPKIQPDGLLDDLWREAVAGIADSRHARGLPRIPSASKRLALMVWTAPARHLAQ